MKTCTVCKIEKSIEDFDKKGNRYSSHCKECRKDYVNSHYKRNKDYYIDKSRKRRPLEKKKYQEYKMSLSCTDCNLSFKDEPYLCDFHHENGDTKSDNPSKFRGSWKRFKEELEKCIPLCPNCHRRRHYKQD